MPNPQVPLSPPDELPDDLRESWQRAREIRGDATFVEAFGCEPRLYRWYVERFYGEVFHGGRVPARIKELARYRLSTTHGCRFCNQGNRSDALAAGVSEADLKAIETDAVDQLQAADRAVVALADQMALTRPEGSLTAELHARLRDHFDDGQIMELGLVMAVLTGMAKFLFVFDLVEREESCPF